MLSRYKNNVSCQKCIDSSFTVMNLFLLSVLVLVFSLMAGCKTLEQGTQKGISASRQFEYQMIEGGGWLSVFLNLKEYQNQEVTLEITAVEVKNQDSWVPLSSSSLTVDTKHHAAGQVMIARNMVAPDIYYSMRLHLRHATVRHGGQEEVLNIPNSVVEVEFPAGLNFKKADSHSLFVSWNVGESVQENGRTFIPAMKASMQAIPLLSELLFLACPEIDTVYVLRSDINWVISSLGIPGRPTYLEVDVSSDRLYVLAADENAIKVVDLKTYRIVDQIIITLDFEPTYMFLGPDMFYAYILDARGKSIAKINILTGTQETQVSLSYIPQYAIYLEDRNLLAVSALDTNKVYLLNPDNLISTNSFSVGSNPDGLLSWRNFVFVAESGSNTVAAYDLQDRTQRNKVNVGFSPRRLFLKGNQIYITNLLSSSVSVMFPGQFNVSGEITVNGKPLELDASESRRWLYVGDVKRGGLNVIDSTSNRIKGFIDLSTIVLGMAVID